MRYEYAIYDILRSFSGLVFNKWNFILVVPLLAWIAMVSPLREYWWIPLSLLVQSLLVCGIVWGVSGRGKEYQNLYRRSLTQKGTFMRYTTIATIIIAAALVAGSVVTLAVQIAIARTEVFHSLEPILVRIAIKSELLRIFVVILLPLALILQLILGVIMSVIVLLASRSQRRRTFRVFMFRSIVSIVRYIVITMVSFLLTHTIWTLSLFISIFCGWLASPLIMDVYRNTSSVVLEEYHVTILFEVLVTSFVLFVLARALIAVWGYRRSNTEGAR